MTTLIRELPQIETEYDVVSGISVGSLNGIAMSSIPIGKEDEYEPLVMGIWKNVVASEVFNLWPGGILEGITDHSALFDDDPLFELLFEQLEGRTLNRELVIGTSDMNTGLYKSSEFAPTG